MKNYVKLIAVVFILSMASESFALRFGAQAGLNLSNMLRKDDIEGILSDDLKMNPGFNVGATVEYPMNETFSIETGLFLLTKGAKNSGEGRDYNPFDDTYTDYVWDSKLNLWYLDIPITAKAMYAIGGAKIFCVFGPYLGIGLYGKSNSEVTRGVLTETHEEKIRWGSDWENDDYLKRLDYGLTFGAGVEIKSIQVGISYGLGLANISSYTNIGATIQNRVWEISVGYKLGKK